jgi:hypothetical protein
VVVFKHYLHVSLDHAVWDRPIEYVDGNDRWKTASELVDRLGGSAGLLPPIIFEAGYSLETKP